MNTTDTIATPIAIPASEATPDIKPDAPKEGASGKGNQHVEASKAQLRKAFESDSAALATVLVALGAIERTQHGKNGVTARRIYAELPTLEANRNKLDASDKKMATAALDALRAVGALRGKFVSIELFSQSVAVRSRKTAGQHHKPTK
jgi:predicted secreted protein